MLPLFGCLLPAVLLLGSPPVFLSISLHIWLRAWHRPEPLVLSGSRGGSLRWVKG